MGTIFSNTLETVAPIKLKKVREKRAEPWYNSYAHSLVVYQGPNQTNQDSIEAWLKHEEPNSTRQQQEVINQTLAPARLNTACNSKTKGTLNDNSNAGIW